MSTYEVTYIDTDYRESKVTAVGESPEAAVQSLRDNAYNRGLPFRGCPTEGVGEIRSVRKVRSDPAPFAPSADADLSAWSERDAQSARFRRSCMDTMRDQDVTS